MATPFRILKCTFVICIALSGITIVVYLFNTGRMTWLWPPPEYTSYVRQNLKTTSTILSTRIPSFAFYVRMTYSPRFATEYKNVFVRSMKLFVPNSIAKLLVVLDAENMMDKKFAEEIMNEWPYPDVCYMTQGNHHVYFKSGKARMFWDMMHPDLCTNATYVGFVDTDTLFDTIVTPQLLFEDSKPIIVAKIGQVPYQCWAKRT